MEIMFAVLLEVSLIACCIPELLCLTSLLACFISVLLGLLIVLVFSGTNSEIKTINGSLIRGDTVALLVQVTSTSVRVTAWVLRSVSMDCSQVIISETVTPKLPTGRYR